MSLSFGNSLKIFSEENFSKNLKQALMEMFTYAEEGLFCDVNLIAAEDGKKITAHRAVLSARNAYFKSMFTGKFKEANDKEVTISGVSGEVLQALVRFCYTGTIEINEDNVQLILPQASMMIFPEIVEACSLFQIASINPANCLHIAKYAKLYNLQGLLKSAEDHMKKNFVNVVVTDGFLKLNEEELQEYLSFTELNVDSEKDKFEAIMRWIDHDSKARSCALSNLLPLIKLQRIEKNYLLEYVLNSARKEYHLALMDGIKDNLSNAQAMSQRTEDEPNKIVVVCYKHIQIYNPAKNTVEFKCSIGDDNFYFYFTPTLVGNKVILFDEEKVRRFDLKTKTWDGTMAPMLTKRRCSSITMLNGYFYAVGGQGDESGCSCELNSVERWDPKSNQWSYVASMNQRRSVHCAAILKGKLYVIGGVDGIAYLMSVECYDPITDRWTMCSPLHTERYYANAVVADNEIFVFGGAMLPFWHPLDENEFDLNSIEKYNSETNTWTVVAHHTSRGKGMGAYLFNEKIYLLGSCTSDEWLKTMEEFDPATNECKLIDTPNIDCVVESRCFPFLFKNK